MHAPPALRSLGSTPLFLIALLVTAPRPMSPEWDRIPSIGEISHFFQILR
jgi:hypothetical protein